MKTVSDLHLTRLHHDKGTGYDNYCARTRGEYEAAVREAEGYLPGARVVRIRAGYACISYLADGKRDLFFLSQE